MLQPVPTERAPRPERSSTACIVIPTWDGWPLLERCLEALDLQLLQPRQIIVVDNGSSDGTAEKLAERWPSVHVVALPVNEGFAGGCNRGIQAARLDLDIVLLNNDTVPAPEWLLSLEKAAAEAADDVGVLSAKLMYPDGRLESTGDFLSSAGIPFQRGRGESDVGQYDDENEIFSACGGASLYRRRMLAQVGLLDEKYFAYYEDVDLCFRARLAGWRVHLVPSAVVTHSGGATSSGIRGFNRYHTARNLWFLLVKNVPGPLLPGLLFKAAAIQTSWLMGAIRHRQLRVSLQAHVDAVKALRSILEGRREVQAARVLTVKEVRALLPRRARDLKTTVFNGH
jgi:GT2 family glycosyltransferase